MPTQPTPQNSRMGMPGYPGRNYPYPQLPTYPYPPSAQQPGVAPPDPTRTLKQKLLDPRLGALLASVGASMSQPRQVGQTGWGQLGSSLASGYNTLAAMRALQEQQALQMREQARKDQELQNDTTRTGAAVRTADAQTTLAGATAENTKARTAEIPKESAREEQKTKASISQGWGRLDVDYKRLEVDRDKIKEDARQADAHLAHLKTTAADRKAIDEAQNKAQMLNAKANMLDAQARMSKTMADIKNDKKNMETGGRYDQAAVARAYELQLDATKALPNASSEVDQQELRKILQDNQDYISSLKTKMGQQPAREQDFSGAGQPATTPPATGAPAPVAAPPPANMTLPPDAVSRMYQNHKSRGGTLTLRQFTDGLRQKGYSFQ